MRACLDGRFIAASPSAIAPAMPPMAGSIASPRRGEPSSYTLAHAGRQLRARTDRLLGRGRHAGDHGGVDHHHRHLFRLPRGCAHPAHRPPGGHAVRLRGSHRRAARPGRPHLQPPAPRPGAVRAEARPDPAPAGGIGIARERAQRAAATSPARSSRPRAAAPPSRASAPLKPSPINDKGAFLLPPIASAPVDPRTSMFAASAGGIGGAHHPPAGLARSGRAAPGDDAQFDGGELRFQGAAHPRRARRARRRRRQGRRRRAHGRHGRPVRPAARSPKDAMAFERQIHRINIARAQVDRLTRTLGTVPVRKPLDGEIEMSSAFGVRIGSVHGLAGDAYRARSARRHRRSGARHRQRQR